MEAPPGGMSVEQLNGFLDREIEGRYEHRDDGKRYCRTCGSVVQQTTCYVSEHEEVFGDGHVGRGSSSRFLFRTARSARECRSGLLLAYTCA